MIAQALQATSDELTVLSRAAGHIQENEWLEFKDGRTADETTFGQVWQQGSTQEQSDEFMAKMGFDMPAMRDEQEVGEIYSQLDHKAQDEVRAFLKQKAAEVRARKSQP